MEHEATYRVTYILESRQPGSRYNIPTTVVAISEEHAVARGLNYIHPDLADVLVGTYVRRVS